MKRLASISMIAIMLVACGESGIMGGTFGSGKKKAKKDSGSGVADEDDITEDEATNGDKNRKIASKGTGFLLKSALQLDNTIKSCLGGGRTTVKGEMLFNLSSGAAGAPADGNGTAFLSPADYSVGENILLKNTDFFDGNSADLRTGVRAGQLSMNYLTALQNAANAVAYNCSVAHLDVGTNSELCECETPEKALDLMSRCLPEYDPSFFDDLVEGFASACATDQKKAVSSFVGSLLFAKEP